MILAFIAAAGVAQTGDGYLAPGTCVSNAGFEEVDAPQLDASVCDPVFNCTHNIRRHSAQSTAWRTVNYDRPGLAADAQAHPGFRTVYSNTLNVTLPSNAGSIHNCSNGEGAQIGVVSNVSLPRMKNVPEGANAYQFNAAGVDGLVMMCFHAVHLPQPAAAPDAAATAATAAVGMVYTYTAKIDVYVAQAGWHEEGDALRVWAETTSNSKSSNDGLLRTQYRAVSMLPGCEDVATKHNVDTLMLRAATPTPRRPYQYTGEPNKAGDPALLADTWEWQTLSVDLASEVSSVGVCAGLQTGAGAEELFIDNLRIERTAAPPYHRNVCKDIAVEEWPWPPQDGWCPGEGPLAHPAAGSDSALHNSAHQKGWQKRIVAAIAIFSLFVFAIASAMVVTKIKQAKTRGAGGSNAAYAAHINVMASEAEA